MIAPFRLDDVAIVTVPATPVAMLQHRGDPALAPTSVQRFVACRKLAGLRPGVSPTFTVLHTDPATTAPDDYRMDLCAGTDGSVPDGLVPGVIPAGRCAVLRASGDDLGPGLTYLISAWLPASGERRRDFPVYVQRYPEQPSAYVDLFLPLQ